MRKSIIIRDQRNASDQRSRQRDPVRRGFRVSPARLPRVNPNDLFCGIDFDAMVERLGRNHDFEFAVEDRDVK
jgi:hypothetical protein